MNSFIKIKFLVLFSIFSIYVNAQNVLTDNTRVSLITLSPGEEIYSTFGHSAIWIYDPQLRIDRVYNYGTFDFNDPNFLPKFVKGKLDYFLSVYDSKYLFYEAQIENRSLLQQTLNLSVHQKNKIFYFLEKNSLPENRFYKYEFFYDNCSTRIRDVFKNELGDSLLLYPSTDRTKTFRNLIDEYLGNQKWGDFGIDLMLGTRTDMVAKPYEYMFLPDYLMWNFDKAKIIINGKKENLIAKKNALFTATPVKPEITFYKEPLFVFWSLFFFIASLTIYQVVSKKYFPIIDVSLFLITGLIGSLIIFAWFFTDHLATVNNFNLIWANPLNLFIAFVFISKKLIKKINLYFLIYAVLNLFMLVFWVVLPQQLHISFIPIILSMAIRAGYLFRKNKSPDKITG